MCIHSASPVWPRRLRHLFCHSSYLFLFLLWISDVTAVPLPDLEDEECRDSGIHAATGSNLLQVHAATGSNHLPPDSPELQDMFGPGQCVGLYRSPEGSCVLKTHCLKKDIKDTEFAFVCYNSDQIMPHTLHSFGRGGFANEEAFDTKVLCKTCTSVDSAFRSGSSVVRNALAALPLGRLPSLWNDRPTPPYNNTAFANFKPEEAAVFGPEYCLTTFRAPAGTCLIRTRCADVDLSGFNVGLTCLDKSGGYTRYLFGKDTFEKEETFDTLIECSKCLGVSSESSMFAMHALLPRNIVEDVGTLKTSVETLSEKVRVLQQASIGKSGSGRRRASAEASEEASEEGENAELQVSRSYAPPIPTIMVSRAQGSSPGVRPDTGKVGEEKASMDDTLHVISHQRAPTITELFRRLKEQK